MMDDHLMLARARNHLADALKALLREDIMGEADFETSRIHARCALGYLDDLLRKRDG